MNAVPPDIAFHDGTQRTQMWAYSRRARTISAESNCIQERQNYKMNEVVPVESTPQEAEKGNSGIPSRPLQSSLRQPKNGNEQPKKGVSFSPDVPLETPNRPPIQEIIRQKESHYFFKRCCVLVVVVLIIVIGVLILASTVHDNRQDHEGIIS